MMPTPQKTPLRGAGAAFLESEYMEEEEVEITETSDNAVSCQERHRAPVLSLILTETLLFRTYLWV